MKLSFKPKNTSKSRYRILIQTLFAGLLSLTTCDFSDDFSVDAGMDANNVDAANVQKGSRAEVKNTLAEKAQPDPIVKKVIPKEEIEMPLAELPPMPPGMTYPPGYADDEVEPYSVRYYAKLDEYGNRRVIVGENGEYEPDMHMIKMMEARAHSMMLIQERRNIRYIIDPITGKKMPIRLHEKTIETLQKLGYSMEEIEEIGIVYLYELSESGDPSEFLDKYGEPLWLIEPYAEIYMAANEEFKRRSGGHSLKFSFCGRNTPLQQNIFPRSYYEIYVKSLYPNYKNDLEGKTRYTKNPYDPEYTGWWIHKGHRATNKNAAPPNTSLHEYGLVCDLQILHRENELRELAKQVLHEFGIINGCDIKRVAPSDTNHTIISGKKARRTGKCPNGVRS